MSKRYRSSSGEFAPIVIGVAFLAVIVLISSLFQYFPRTSVQQAVVKVCDKEAVTVSKSNQYRVYTSNGVYVVEDYWPMVGLNDGSRFNSADFYQAIKPGTVYKITAYGWRNGFFSWFPNITEATPTDATPVGSC